MEEQKELNLVEVLKECLKGAELWSPIFGDLTFEELDMDCEHIVCRDGQNLKVYFEINGKYSECIGAEVMIFPSKDNRDWSTFQRPFVDGDVVATESGVQIFVCEDKQYCYFGWDFRYNKLFKAGMWSFSRHATEEEKQKLFDAIKDNGYKWNPETKTLEKLEEEKQKWNPDTLQPFDKVLVRDNVSQYWCGNLYLYTDKETDSEYPYFCINDSVKYCIPFNDDTKHLLGTSDEAPEYYRQ